MSSSQSTSDFGGTTSADHGGGGDEQLQPAKTYTGLSLINNELVNMTNCYNHCKRFFEFFGSIHFKVLIAYWMMAGYLGDGVRSVEAAYNKGIDILIKLVYKEKMLRLSDDDRGMIEFAGSSPNANCSCRHRGFCFVADYDRVRIFDVLFGEVGKIGRVVLSKDEMLSANRIGSKLRVDPSSSSYPYFLSQEDQELNKYFADFNLTTECVKPLLEQVESPSVLLLRGFEELSLQSDCFPLDRLKTLTVLEISGSTGLTTIPENTISQLVDLKRLNLSDLPIEALPSGLFCDLDELRWLVLRGCSKLLSLDLFIFGFLEVLDLSHCTALQIVNVPDPDTWHPTLQVLDLSYTRLLPYQFISSESRPPSYLYLRGLNLKGLGSVTRSDYIQVIDLSGCSCFSNLDEGLVDNMPYLQRLDLSWTKVKHLPSLSKLTRLRALSLSGLELDSLDTLASLPNQLIELDLTGIKISSSQELKLDFLESLEHLQLLNLSQTRVARLPDMSRLVSLKELLLADCQHLKVVPCLQALTNLETLDLSLPNDSSTSDNRQLVIETDGHLSSFPVPKSIRKLALTNRSGVQKIFSMTTLANLNLEFLDLRGTDLTGWDSKLEPQIRIPKPTEIHIVSVNTESNNQQPMPPSGFDHFDDAFVKLHALVSDIKENIKSPLAQEQVERLLLDLRYIQKNFDRLKSSSNWKNGKELLQELMNATTNLAAADFAVDSANFKQLLRVVVKLKLLVPRKQIDGSEALEITNHKKKKPLFRTSQTRENDVMTDIFRGMNRVEPDLLSSYRSLSTIQKNCLLCFSIFPYNEEREKNTGLLKSLLVKKKILVYWWVGEGFIDPHHEESVDPELTLNQSPDPDHQMMIISRDIDAVEQFSAAKGVKKPKVVEEIGKQVLKVLAEKGFIEFVFIKGRESGSCCIHPFVHCFVIERAKEEGFFDFNQESGMIAPSFTRSGRACLLKPQDSVLSSCNLWANYVNSSKKLESFGTVTTLFNVNDTMIDIKKEWFSQMKNLSVLHLGIWNSENADLIEVSDQKFMEGLKKMRQLRLISLQGLPTIKKLPDSVCNLSNLVILDLKECTYLEELPADIGSLKSLTHLDISNCPLLYKLPKGISLLSKLEVLRGFLITDIFQDVRDCQVTNVSILSHWWKKTKRCGLFFYKNNEVCTLRDLLKLDRLRELSIVVNISKFPEDRDLQVFKEMKNLCKLKILWERSISSTESAEAVMGRETLMGQNMEKLELWCFPYENTPYWLNPGELKNLKKLYVVGGSLRTLHVSGTDESRWNVVTLRLKHLRNLDTQWPELKSIFPQLLYLENYQCDKLVIFPCDDEGVWRSAS